MDEWIWGNTFEANITNQRSGREKSFARNNAFYPEGFIIPRSTRLSKRNRVYKVKSSE
jgi:hypothetical protein